MSVKCDVLVLGAGMVGVSAALALQARGRGVVLLDRRGAAEETSHGNAGIIQREAVVPYTFPRDWKVILNYALNRRTEAHLHHWDLLGLAPWLCKHFLNSAPDRVEATARAARPLVERCIDEHESLMHAAGIAGVMRRTGYLRLHRSAERLEAELSAAEAAAVRWGVLSEAVSVARLRELEPHLTGLDVSIAGGVLKPQAVSVPDPGAVGKAYAALFRERGGRLLTGDARGLASAHEGWRLAADEGEIQAREVVVALGPWSNEALRPLGIELPLIGKRGYHKHYAARTGATLSRPVLDVEGGYVLAPMTRGIRLTTGAEFARFDAPPTPVQIDKCEPQAREIFPLGEAVDQEAWLGRRPCLPDMLPAIGPVPGQRGLWLDFGHHHLGFTLGPVSARLLAEMMTGETPFTDPAPYRPERFG